MNWNNFKTHRFYKEKGIWYIDLKNWVGPKAALAMVKGADTFLDMLSNNTGEVFVNFSDKEFEGSEELKRVKKISQFKGGGADYVCPSHNNHKMWLCNVTLFVFGGYFPKSIWFNKAET